VTQQPAWRRQHGADIVSQVGPAKSRGRWKASAWRTSQPDEIVSTIRPIARLMSAQAKADGLARRRFNHVCDVLHCGIWFPILLGL
jgi:hypothetical protein